MIIHFDCPSDKLIGIRNQEVEECLISLLRVHRAGHNLVVISRRTVLWCSANIVLNERDAATLRQIELNVTQSGDLVRRAKYYMVVAEPGLRFELVDSQKIVLPMDHVDFHSLIMCPVVVVEDIENDGTILESVIRKSVSKVVPFSRLKEGIIHGGGDRLKQVVRGKIEDGRVIWVIIDSDKKTPYLQNDKSAAIVNDINGINYPAVFCRVLSCAEIENVVSLEVWKNVAKGSERISIETLVLIENEERHRGLPLEERLSLYFDMKNGLSNKDIEQVDSDRDKNWFRSRVQMAGLDPNDFEIRGLGGRPMKRLIALDTLPQLVDAMLSSKEWSEQHDSMVQDALWLFLSPLPQRT